jgi:hypothetical protein
LGELSLIISVKGHRDAPRQEGETDEEYADRVGNTMADSLADQGAALHP